MVLVEKGDIAELIETGQFDEGVELEAKRASGQIPRAAWDSISAFANTIGGALVLGLLEEGDGWSAEGVSDPSRMIQDLHNLMRDRSKISHDVVGHDDIWVETINGRQLVVVRIRPAPRRNKPVFINGDRNRAYVRRNEGDALCTDFELDPMRREATPLPYDSQILSGFGWEDLDIGTIARYRAMSKEARPQLGHHRLDDKEFLRASRAWGRDRDTGSEGPTVAGL